MILQFVSASKLVCVRFLPIKNDLGVTEASIKTPLSDEKLLSFIDQIKIYDNFKINHKIISILKRRESKIVCKLLYKYSLNKELEIAKYAIFSLGSIWNDNSFEQLSKLENEIKDPSLLKCIKNQKLISNQFLINK